MTTRVRRKIGGVKCYKPWKDWENGDYIVGKYIGQSIDSFDKPNFHIELEEVSMVSAKASNGSKLEAGVILGLNASGQLVPKFDSLKVGDVVDVTYRGIESLPDNHRFKGKDCHQIDVSVLEESKERELEFDYDPEGDNYDL
jgi:hypothetical protein